MIADMSLNATSWRRIRRFTTSLRPSQSSLHAPFLKCGLFACSALNARSNDCHVGLLCMTQRAQYRTQMWVRTLCVVVRTDFLCYPLHFQHKKLNSPWRCSRVPVRAVTLFSSSTMSGRPRSSVCLASARAAKSLPRAPPHTATAARIPPDGRAVAHARFPHTRLLTAASARMLLSRSILCQSHAAPACAPDCSLPN